MFKKLVQLFLNALLMVLFFVVLVMIFVLFEMLEILLGKYIAVVSCWNFMDRGIKNVGSSCGSCLLRTQL